MSIVVPPWIMLYLFHAISPAVSLSGEGGAFNQLPGTTLLHIS